MTHRTPRELIEIYRERVYNSGEVELVREVCANPIIRHDPNCITALNHDEQIARVLRSVALKPLFTHRVLHADSRFVTSVWNMASRDGRDIQLCGIEVFEAQDGRFTRCWNSGYEKGAWGEDGEDFDPAALKPPELVGTAQAITADWLQRALAAGGAVVPQRIAMKPEITPLGHGTTSETVLVRATYNSGIITAPTSLVCKIGRPLPGALGSTSPFERERQAYMMFGDRPGFRIPQVYFNETDATGLCNLLLEDLSASTRAGDQIAGCSVDEAAAVVRELARFHQAWWEKPRLRQQPWMSQQDQYLPAYEKGSAIIENWLADRLPQEVIRTVREFQVLAKRWIAQVPLRRTLIHGDPRVDNVLFEDKPDGPSACLIDWQSLRVGDPQCDVAYVMTGSLAPKARQAAERDLLAEYVEMVAATDPSYTLELALSSYRANIVSGLWLTVIAAAYVDRTEFNADLIVALVTRNAAAVTEWGPLRAIAERF
jgi:hypothetical protein